MPGCRVATILLLLAVQAAPAHALETGKYRFELGAEIRAVRAHDVDGDGRRDLVVIAEQIEGTQREWVVFVLRTPATPTKRTFFAPDQVTRIPMRESPAVAAISVGRFADGATLRFFEPTRITDRDARGAVVKVHELTTLLGRSTGRPVVFWDSTADLDGDGGDESWVPSGRGDGNIVVLRSRRGDTVTLSAQANNQGSRSPEHGLSRAAYVPQLVPADLDGDGRRELVALRERSLVGWDVNTASKVPLAPRFELVLPFLEPDVSLSAESMRVPRIQLEDVDADGTVDMLVTLISGRRDQLGSLRTTLFHFPGPFVDPESGKLVSHRARIDTESVALHPQFIDLDGDGALDYVGDSIRGSQSDLIARIMGQDPQIHYVGFRFDRKQGTFQDTPFFTLPRLYPSSQALSNQFNQVGWLEGDFDGDRVADLLDTGNLSGVEILRGVPKTGSGPGDPLGFAEVLMPRIEVKDGLTPGAVVSDLTGDGLDDAVLWGTDVLYLVVPKARR